MRVLEDILAMMAHLRDEKKGSAWDKAQDFKSIVPYTLEESYELIEAIEEGSPQAIQSELGDLFYQIVYYAQLASEQDWFDFHDILQGLKEKLEKRHGTFFNPTSSSTEALPNNQTTHETWERVKAEERHQKYGEDILAGIPLTLPGLVRAQKLQDRAATYGFDWPNIQCVIEKLKEEVLEFDEACHSTDHAHALEELSDVFFVCTNLARHLKTDAETLMRAANRKFERRFEGVAELVKQSGMPWSAFTLEELDRFWREVKLTEN